MGDYVMEKRKRIGHAPLLCVGCGVIIENEHGDILLQRRTDDDTWGTPGGGMNFGETFIETATREAFEETGLRVEELTLFCLYSGKNSIIEYPNKDICFGALVIFKTNKYTGELTPCPTESKELRFFSKNGLPPNINRGCGKWIEQWQKGRESVFID